MRKRELGLTACAVLLAAVVANPVQARIYKWTDDDGQVHYTQMPPPGDTQAETMEPRTGGTSDEALKELERAKARAEAMEKAREKEAREEQLAADEKAWREENCRRARDRLHSYSVPNALIRQDDGSRIRVDEETRQRELAKSREMIEKYCN